MRLCICKHLGCCPTSCIRTPKTIKYTYDTDPKNRGSVNWCVGRKKVPKRLNIEVGYSPEAQLPGEDARFPEGRVNFLMVSVLAFTGASEGTYNDL